MIRFLVLDLLVCLSPLLSPLLSARRPMDVVVTRISPHHYDYVDNLRQHSNTPSGVGCLTLLGRTMRTRAESLTQG
ncbi:hypothetical protein F5Y12DRAFT_768236 [Xylaria sp. FL1777]|nr:hypothetical protein F5Y12DRAFT_768236 [Xylaria sp. FL1777]